MEKEKEKRMSGESKAVTDKEMKNERNKSCGREDSVQAQGQEMNAQSHRPQGHRQRQERKKT